MLLSTSARSTRANPSGELLPTPAWIEKSQRIAQAAIPFFSLYKPLGNPLALMMSGTRVYSTLIQLVVETQKGDAASVKYQLLETAIAVASLAGTIFAHPVGMLISTTRDLIVEVHGLTKHIRSAEYRQILLDCLKITSLTLSLALFLGGNTGVLIASLSMQTILGLHQSLAEFKKGNLIEGVGHLLMVAMIGNQTVGQIQVLQTQKKMNAFRQHLENIKKNLDVSGSLQPAESPMGTYVGELQELWQFPSDHLPIGITIDDLHIVSWNVLDADYMDWVLEKNSQGLSRSMIADEHVYIGNSGLTVRDLHVADLILQMISHPSHPRNILSLQECSKPFIDHLSSILPSHFEIVSNHGEAVIFNSNIFELISANEISGIFSHTPTRTFQDIILRRLDSDQQLRLVNVHLPGDPAHPARFEFAQYLQQTFDPSQTLLAMGDMNFNEIEMMDAMIKAFPNHSIFSLFSPYCTNISPFSFISKAIDHFIVYSPYGSRVITSSPNQILPGLDKIVSLLEKTATPPLRLSSTEIFQIPPRKKVKWVHLTLGQGSSFSLPVLQVG
jgi:hypothetical protein